MIVNEELLGVRRGGLQRRWDHTATTVAWQPAVFRTSLELLRQIQRRIAREEVVRPQLELVPHRRHHRPIFGMLCGGPTLQSHDRPASTLPGPPNSRNAIPLSTIPQP